MIVTVRSFAKINLGLSIGGLRPDGFHDLRTVYQTIALHDIIRVQVGRGTGIEIRCEDPRVPRDSSNTCYRVAERAMDALRARGRVTITIDKDCQYKAAWARVRRMPWLYCSRWNGPSRTRLPGGKAAHRSRGWLGFAFVPTRRDGAGGGAWGGSLSVAGFARHPLRGRDSRDWGLDSRRICGLGPILAGRAQPGRTRLQSCQKCDARHGGFSRKGAAELRSARTGRGPGPTQAPEGSKLTLPALR